MVEGSREKNLRVTRASLQRRALEIANSQAVFVSSVVVSS